MEPLRFSCVASFEATHFLFSQKCAKNEREEIGMKSKATALILSVLVGGLGIDRFYLGYIGIGVVKLLTAGCLGVLWIIDIVNIASGNLLPADGVPYKEDSENVIKAEPRSEDPIDSLERISKLHDQGVLDNEEFATIKAQILSKM